MLLQFDCSQVLILNGLLSVSIHMSMRMGAIFAIQAFAVGSALQPIFKAFAIILQAPAVLAVAALQHGHCHYRFLHLSNLNVFLIRIIVWVWVGCMLRSRQCLLWLLKKVGLGFAFEGERVLKAYLLDLILDGLSEGGSVLAVGAGAVLAASQSLRETLAVQFEALRLAAIALHVFAFQLIPLCKVHVLQFA